MICSPMHAVIERASHDSGRWEPEERKD